MFKKLRNHFLLMHMGMVSLLVVVFFGSILFFTYRLMEAGTDRRLDGFVRMRSRIISGGAFEVADVSPELWDGHPDGVRSVTDGKSADKQSGGALNASGGEPFGESNVMYKIPQANSPRGPADESSIGIQMRTDRMTPGIFIIMDENRQIAEVDDIFEMGEQFYARVTDAVISMEETKPRRVNTSGEDVDKSPPRDGKIRLDDIELKYRMTGNEIALISITQESALFYNMLRLFLTIALPLLLVIFLVSMFFARAAIKPIETSYNRQKEFIADASHELRTPLATIGANLDVLDGTATEEQRQWVGYIKSETERMSGLTNSLLYLAKMDFAQKDGNRSEVNIGQLVEDRLLPFEAVLFEKGRSLNVNVAPDALIRGDAEQLRRLIGILTDNAFRYASGAVEVKVEKIQNQVWLVIENDGPGIAPEEMNKIWERFYRSDKARLYDGGYGLGLPMAKAIVDRHGGSIFCESEPGVKTKFVVKLPSLR